MAGFFGVFGFIGAILNKIFGTIGYLLSSSSGKIVRPTKDDMQTKSELTELYNQPVCLAEHVHRPIKSTGGIINHEGVRITTNSGKQWLVHKGQGYGNSSQTVVTDAKHMSDQWMVKKEKRVSGHTVRDFVRAGGENYSRFFDNCWDGSKRMMNLGDSDLPSD